MLTINSLDFSLAKKQILAGVDFNAVAGEFIGIIGANGAGKSTLLKCIAGINSYSGTITYNNNSLTALSSTDCAKIIGYMEQDIVPDFPFTVHEIVTMGRYPHLGRLSSETAADNIIVDNALIVTQSDHLRTRNFQQLSGGERQRVLFARILAQQTPVLLLDEPTSALDIACKETLFELMQTEAANGKCVIATIHDIKDAARYCSRLIVMKSGNIIADGAPEAILNDELVSEAYGLEAVVYFNRLSGGMDYFVHKTAVSGNAKRIHLICGGGVGSGIARYLLGEGHQVTMGVLAYGDSDLEFALLTGIPAVSEKPYSPISDATYAKNVNHIETADTVILTNIPFGKQTLRNLEACQFAKHLIILEDEPITARDFSGGDATVRYNALRENATIIKTAELSTLL
ncbi:MAG: ABC transporter ATP-binding protein [Bacillota bacterium]